jgi:hypothetical protein
MVVFTDALVNTRSRFLIVVRRGDQATYEYLRKRLAGVYGVEIMLDRREHRPAAPSDDRRRAPTRFNAFGVLLVRR